MFKPMQRCVVTRHVIMSFNKYLRILNKMKFLDSSAVIPKETFVKNAF